MTEPTDYEAMAELIARMGELNAELRAHAEEQGVPALERNAARIDAALRTLRTNVPPELVDRRD